MAAEIKSAIGVDAELIGGGGGVFDVVVNDKLVFSKATEDRFPNEGEVAAALG